MDNNNIKNGDKLVATNDLAGFFNKGDIVEVTNILNDIISFSFGDDLSNVGFMNASTCAEYFEKKLEKLTSLNASETTYENMEITHEYVEEIMENSDIEAWTAFDKCTVVSCRLPNGFVITESSACIDPANYDEEIGIDICLDKIADKIWELEAYRLQQFMWEEEMTTECCHACDNNCECCGFNDESYNKEEFDECFDTDLDCDDCDDYKCPYNTNDSLY